MFPPKPQPNYIALLAVIIFGVAIGNLVSNWVTAKIIEYKVERTAQELNKELVEQARNTKAFANANAEQQATTRKMQEQQIIEQRRTDKIGSRLAQSCTEWKKADNEMVTYTTKRETEKHCSSYESYLLTGVIPPSR